MHVLREIVWSLEEGVVLICFSQSWLDWKDSHTLSINLIDWDRTWHPEPNAHAHVGDLTLGSVALTVVADGSFEIGPYVHQVATTVGRDTTMYAVAVL
jgi:hypothetical protein